MSGIAGILRFDGAPVEAGLVERMTAAMAHRGPDGIGHWHGGPAALGHCRLCATAESLEEAQPLANEDASLVLVMHGFLDDPEELRAELAARGARLRSRSDAELVLRAYERWGRDCLERLDGDFALAVWDARRRLAFLARDRFGNKPLNYHWDGTTLAFASELHAILALPGARQELNEGLLADYLAGDWRSCTETPWKGIERLPPAHIMEVTAAGPRPSCYWSPDLGATLPHRTDAEYVEHYRAMLADCVRRASRTHRPLACEVSGGLDSSAIFAVAAAELRQGRLAAPALAGFTLRSDGDPAADELEYARAVAAHVGLPVEEVAATHMPLAWYGECAAKYRDFPGYPNGIMGWGIRQRAAERSCRVLLTGVGGDEWFTGSRDYYAEELAAGRVRSFLGCLGADLREAGATEALRSLARGLAESFLPGAALRGLRALRARTRAPATETRDWLSPRLREIDRERAERYRSPTAGVAFARAGQARLHEALFYPFDILARELEERLAASLGLELRHPLSSTAMVEFAYALPERLRLRGQTTKFVHRCAVAGLLPEQVRDRATKADFMGAFRRHEADVRQAVRDLAPSQAQEWVPLDALRARMAQFGDPALNGSPEWALWSWLGWRLLRRSAAS